MNAQLHERSISWLVTPLNQKLGVFVKRNEIVFSILIMRDCWSWQ